MLDNGSLHSPGMAATAWTDRGQRAMAVLRVLIGSRSNHTALKPCYDALIIGGGEKQQHNLGK